MFAVGVLGQAAAWLPSQITGLVVAASAVVVVLAVALALRILVVFDRPPSSTTPDPQAASDRELKLRGSQEKDSVVVRSRTQS